MCTHSPKQDAPEIPSMSVETVSCLLNRVFYGKYAHSITGVWDISVLSQLHSVYEEALLCPRETSVMGMGI